MTNYHQQSGTVLIVGILLLSVLTLIGISSMGFSQLNEKMANNLRDNEIAFQSAESALEDGESWVRLLSQPPEGVDTCASAPCDLWVVNSFANLQLKDTAWWNTNAKPFSSVLSEVSSQPRYVIEEQGFVPYELNPDLRSKGQGYHYYKVTARGTGATDTAVEVVQSIYATQFN